MPNEDLDAMVATMKKAAGALREAGVPFMLGGGLATWARGGPASVHDLDLMVRREDADEALATLAAAGLRPERPPEGWLYKAWDDNDVLVDLIFAPTGVAITEETFERADEMEVQAVPMKVMSSEDVLVTKLRALGRVALRRGLLLARGGTRNHRGAGEGRVAPGRALGAVRKLRRKVAADRLAGEPPQPYDLLPHH